MGESMSSLLIVCNDKNLYMCNNNYSRWQRTHLVDLTMWYTIYWLDTADFDQIIWAGEYYRAWFEYIHVSIDTSIDDIVISLLQRHTCRDNIIITRSICI